MDALEEIHRGRHQPEEQLRLPQSLENQGYGKQSASKLESGYTVPNNETSNVSANSMDSCSDVIALIMWAVLLGKATNLVASL